MLKGGTTSFELEVLAILKGGAKNVHPLKDGAQKVLPWQGGGGAQKVSDTQFSHFVAISPVSNDQSPIPILYVFYGLGSLQ